MNCSVCERTFRNTRRSSRLRSAPVKMPGTAKNATTARAAIRARAAGIRLKRLWSGFIFVPFLSLLGVTSFLLPYESTPPEEFLRSSKVSASRFRLRKRRLCRRHAGLLHLAVPPPEQVDRGVDEKLHDERGEDAADHGGGDSLHDVGAGARGPHDRNESEEGARHRHDLGANALDGTVEDRVVQVFPGAHQPRLLALVVGEVEIEEHEDPRLGVEAQ